MFCIISLTVSISEVEVVGWKCKMNGEKAERFGILNSPLSWCLFPVYNVAYWFTCSICLFLFLQFFSMITLPYTYLHTKPSPSWIVSSFSPLLLIFLLPCYQSPQQSQTFSERLLTWRQLQGVTWAVSVGHCTWLRAQNYWAWPLLCGTLLSIALSRCFPFFSVHYWCIG